METRKDSLHLDADEKQVFFGRQLEHVKATAYEVKYKNLYATELIPVSNEAPSGADTITFRKYGKAGIAKVVSDYANDFPRADVYGVEETVKVRSLGSSYGYSIKEIRRSQMTGANLDTRRATAARRAIDELLEKIAFSGQPENNIQGLLNYPGISEYTLQADGTGNSKLWSKKTPDQILRDVNGLLSYVNEVTNGRERPDTLLLPIAQYNAIAGTRIGNESTVLKFILANIEQLTTIRPLGELKGYGAGGADRMFVYVRDPENVTLEIPQPFEQIGADKKGMEYEVPCHMETAGVICYYPLSMAYADGL